MIPLRIRLLGGLHLSRGDEPLPAFPTQRARSLFAYVTLHRSRLHARQLVIGQRWGDESESIGAAPDGA
jgi:DNA-binding SARP family transcriptional activator